MAYGTVSVYLAAIRKFYVMNDIQLNWDRIHSYQGDNEKMTEDRPYTHSEIHQMISHTSIRNKAIILLMWSGGLRAGAIPPLRIKDLEPIDRYSIYKVNVYYFSFCSPETRSAIQNYLSWRKRWGDKLHEDEPLFRQDFNTSTLPSLSSPSYHNNDDDGGGDGGGHQSKQMIKPLKVEGIKWTIGKILKNTGIRPVLPRIEDYRHHRSNIMTCHGMRKGFETNAYKSGMDHIYIRRLMGQKSGLEDSYLKISEDELLEGDSKHTGFIGIIDQISIDDTQRLKQEKQILRIEKSKVDGVLSELAQIKQSLGLV